MATNRPLTAPFLAGPPTMQAFDVLARGLAVELDERRICVNAIAPGAIATDFGGGAVRDKEA